MKLSFEVLGGRGGGRVRGGGGGIVRACVHAWKNGVKIHVRGGFTIHRRSSRFGTPYPFDMIVQNLNFLLRVKISFAFSALRWRL